MGLKRLFRDLALTELGGCYLEGELDAGELEDGTNGEGRASA